MKFFFILYLFCQCFSSFSLYKRNLSPTRKANNRGVSKPEQEEQEVRVLRLWSTPPRQKQPNAEGQEKKSAADPESVRPRGLASVLQVWGRNLRLRRGLEFDFLLFLSLKQQPVASACPCASPRWLTWLQARPRHCHWSDCEKRSLRRWTTCGILPRGLQGHAERVRG